MSTARLLRALDASAAAHGCVARFEVAVSRDWASAVFVGAQVEVRASLDAGAAAERWIAALPTADLPMPRQFANEVRVVRRGDTDGHVAVTIEAVVLED